MFARRLHSALHDVGGSRDTVSQPRLNLLLSYGGWRDDELERQLPPLLRPMGVQCLEARTGMQAEDLVRRERIHVAVVVVRPCQCKVCCSGGDAAAGNLGSMSWRWWCDCSVGVGGGACGMHTPSNANMCCTAAAHLVSARHL